VPARDWQTTGHELLGTKLWRSDGLEATVVSFCPEVEYSGGAVEDKGGAAGGFGESKLVGRKAMFRTKVTNAHLFMPESPIKVDPPTTTTASGATASPDAAADDPNTWTLCEFQVQGFADAWALKTERGQVEEELQGPLRVSISSYVGRSLSLAEDLFKNGKKGKEFKHGACPRERAKGAHASEPRERARASQGSARERA
jgi:hypothetical protein